MMINLLRNEISNFTSVKTIFIWLVIIISPIIITLVRLNQYSLIDSLDFFELIMTAFLPLLFPLIVVIIYLVPFSNEITNNFLFYTRLRVSIHRYLAVKIIANSIMVFVILFSFSFIPFLFVFYLEPLFGFVNYEPENTGLSESELIKDTYKRLTFSQLIEYSSFAYGFLYSIWVGVNGVVYATLGFFALLLTKNKFVALSIPFLLYHLGSFIIAVVDFPMFLLDASIFPFNTVQFPISVVFIPFLFLLFCCCGLFIYIYKHIHQLDSIK